MKTNNEVQFSRSVAAVKSKPQQGHTLAEVMVSVAVIGFMLVSLYAGFSSGFALVRLARENLRATQILAERMEVLRLVKWSDLQKPGFIPLTFTAPFYANNGSQGNFVYSGKVTISSNSPLAATGETYSNNMKMIQIELTWTNGNIMRKREMTTFVSQVGLQNYIYGLGSQPSTSHSSGHNNDN
jgi:type II secretory pathway pseudopilin PulG